MLLVIIYDKVNKFFKNYFKLWLLSINLGLVWKVVMLPGARSAVVLVDSLWDHSEKTFMNHVGSFNYSCIDIKYMQNHAQVV